MSDAKNQNFTLDFPGVEEYVPFEPGQGSDLLPWQGMTFGRIAMIEKGESKEAKNKTLEMTVVVEEEGAEGLKVFKSQAVTGVRTDKKPNIIGLYDVLVSAYSATEANQEVALAKLRAFQGKQLDVDSMIAELLNQKVYIQVETKRFLRKDQSPGWSSDLKNFIVKDRYDAAKGLGTHHRANPADATTGKTSPTPAPGSTATTNNVAASGRTVL